MLATPGCVLNIRQQACRFFNFTISFIVKYLSSILHTMHVGTNTILMSTIVDTILTKTLRYLENDKCVITKKHCNISNTMNLFQFSAQTLKFSRVLGCSSILQKLVHPVIKDVQRSVFDTYNIQHNKDKFIHESFVFNIHCRDQVFLYSLSVSTSVFIQLQSNLRSCNCTYTQLLLIR